MAENISQTQPDYYYGAQRANQIAGQAIEDEQEEDEGEEEEDEEDDETDMASSANNTFCTQSLERWPCMRMMTKAKCPWQPTISDCL
jgi:hypothetical protein